MTNGDRIRSMSNEELAKLLYSHGCVPDDVICPRIYGQAGCEICWMDWLMQEAEE